MIESSDTETICQLRSEIGQLKYQLEKQAADNAEVLRFWRFDPSGNPRKDCSAMVCDIFSFP